MQATEHGQVVVITGAARGIGLATAHAFAAAGARVVIGDLDADAARRAAAEVSPGALGLALDVTDHAGFTAFLDTVEREVAAIDVLVNNAGIMPVALLAHEDDDTTRRILDINTAAVIHGTREAVRRMVPRGSGHVVNLASVVGKVGVAGGATYSASKFAVVGLCEAVRAELRGTGVDISVVLPTIVRTELSAGLAQTRLSSHVEPADVAGAIVRAVERKRFEVWVPRHLGMLDKLTRPLPRAFGEWLLRASGSDRLMADAANSPARAAYEQRAASSAPSHRRGGLEPDQAVR
ncbi:MAG TPA: SDR family NAD(P)-dependent oxidoreductase [Jatrophihabitans sp.]|jgi:NAD(P)-dependent dehydrogenase (short-subunit alcohol dehydrogenase family)